MTKAAKSKRRHLSWKARPSPGDLIRSVPTYYNPNIYLVLSLTEDLDGYGCQGLNIDLLCLNDLSRGVLWLPKVNKRKDWIVLD